MASSGRWRGTARTRGGGSRSARANIAPTTSASTGARSADSVESRAGEHRSRLRAPARARGSADAGELPLAALERERKRRAPFLAGKRAAHDCGGVTRGAGCVHGDGLDRQVEVVDFGELVFYGAPAAPRRGVQALHQRAREVVRADLLLVPGGDVGLQVGD